MPTLDEIANTYLEGFGAQQLGPDWRQKREMQEAQVESERMRPEMMRTQMRGEEARIRGTEAGIETEELQQQRIQEELNEMRQQREEILAQVKAGVIPSTNLKVVDYLIRQKESEARILSEKAQAAAARASAGLHGAQQRRVEQDILSPEDLKTQRDLENRFLQSRIDATKALGESREMGVPRGVPENAWQEAQAEALAEMEQGEAGLLERHPGLMFGRRSTAQPEPVRVQGTPEWNAELLKRTQDKLRQRGYPLAALSRPAQPGQSAAPAAPAGATPAGPRKVRDIASGQEYMELPNGTRIPLSGGQRVPQLPLPPDFEF